MKLIAAILFRFDTFIRRSFCLTTKMNDTNQPRLIKKAYNLERRSRPIVN